MIATQLKKLAAAREEHARPERTAANELPQELSQLPGPYGFSDALVIHQGGNAPADSRGGKTPARPKKVAAVTKTGRLTFTETGFLDSGHPTILAAVHGEICPR